ncbi:hypothetical protein KY366_03185 [Candidatus Woesearchaeota archaeon]|nr:hypothetical protein [Candidatus Woesearchaeota archaeon]
MKISDADRERIQKKITNTYVPLRKLIFEDNKKEVDIAQNFTEYSHVLASVEMILHSFVVANPETKDQDILCALKTLKENPLYEPSRSEEDALEFAIVYGMSRALQQKRLTINEVNALLDWLIHEVEGRTRKNESYIKWLKRFLNSNLRGDPTNQNDKPKRSAIGIPFYTEADWQIQCRNSVDDSGFKNYEEMLEHTQKLKKDIESKGYHVKDVPINATVMQEYFEKNGLKNNSENRSSYVADLLRKGE